VIGRTIKVDGGPSVIIGVLQEGFRYLDMPGAGRALLRIYDRQG